MNIPKKTLWHLDPLTGIPAENTIADFKYSYNYNATVFIPYLRTLCECIRGDQRTGLPFIWKDWDLNPEKVHVYIVVYKVKLHACTAACHSYPFKKTMLIAEC